MKAIFINGSPRKGHNTHKLITEAMRGAVEAGAEAKIINLYDYTYKGCQSCFACKLKGSTTNGICAMRDELRPVFEEIMDADILVVGAPIYFGFVNAATVTFLERLEFPIAEYKAPENGKRVRVLPKAKKVGLIIDMGCPDEAMRKIGYTERCESIAANLAGLLSDDECPIVYSCDTYQFSDYDKYDVPMFSVEAKAKQRAEQFPIDLENAYKLGKALAGKC